MYDNYAKDKREEERITKAVVTSPLDPLKCLKFSDVEIITDRVEQLKGVDLKARRGKNTTIYVDVKYTYADDVTSWKTSAIFEVESSPGHPGWMFKEDAKTTHILQVYYNNRGDIRLIFFPFSFVKKVVKLYKTNKLDKVKGKLIHSHNKNSNLIIVIPFDQIPATEIITRY